MDMTWQDVERAGAKAMITTKPLAWLLNFMQFDLNDYTALECLTLSLELQAFQLRGWVASQGHKTASRRVWKGRDHRPVKGTPLSAARPPALPSEEEIRTDQDLARKYVRAFVKKNLVTIPVGRTQLWISRNTEEGWSAASPVLHSSNEDFLWNLGHLLGGEGLRVNVCRDQGCQRYFVGRLNKEYCSTRCQNRVKTRRHRDRQKRKKAPSRRRRRKGRR